MNQIRSSVMSGLTAITQRVSIKLIKTLYNKPSKKVKMRGSFLSLGSA